MFLDKESLIMAASFESAHHISTNLPANACQEINESLLIRKYTNKTNTPLFLQWKFLFYIKLTI